MRFLNLFFQFHVPEVLEWKIAHSLWFKKAQNTEKSPKNDCVTSLRNLQDVSEHPVYSICSGNWWGKYVCTILCKFSRSKDLRCLLFITRTWWWWKLYYGLFFLRGKLMHGNKIMYSERLYNHDHEIQYYIIST